MREVVIVGGARTPVGDFNGSLASKNPVDLGIIALKAALEKSGVSAGLIEEVVGGHCNQSSSPGNSARLIALGAGCPIESTAVTVHQQCPSSMRAAEVCSQQIMLGKIEVGATVGVESMTNTPYYLMRARQGYRLGHGEKILDGLMVGGLIDPWNDYHMGVTAENIAEKYNISREEQDELALLSHQRACNAIAKGWFKDEIVPVEVTTRKGTTIVDTDEHPRADTTLESLAKLRPAFKKGGTLTAGNASGLNDGGAALIMMSAEKAKELGIKPLARVVASASGAVDPSIMGMGVVPAVRKALKFAGMTQDEIDYWEINEAFAAQFLGATLNIATSKVISWVKYLSCSLN
jgi:acetyl-CoA C-acetyltransferase